MSTDTGVPLHIDSVPVHVASVADGVGLGAPPQAPQNYRAVYGTTTFQATGVAEPLLPTSDDRIIAWVQAFTSDATVGGNQSDVASGYGTTISHSNTAPFPIQDSAAVYVAGTAGSKFTVHAIYRR